MKLIPVTFFATIYPKNKMEPPYQATICGYAAAEDIGLGKPPAGPPGTPGHPLPDPPVIPPVDPPPPDQPLDQLVTLVAKEPPAAGGWGWFPEYGWVYYPGPTGAQPKK